MKIRELMIALAAAVSATASGANVVEVSPCEGDATAMLRSAIEKAASYGGKPVTIRLAPGDYHISRTESTPRLYHISNTASAEENPDQTKHIGLLFRNLRNVTFDGGGAWIVTHGEMTAIAADSCTNLTLTDFTLTSADPSVPEMRVVNVDRTSVTYEITPPSRFEVTDGKFSFVGEGWRFADGYAQVFYPERNVTARCESPLQGRKHVQWLGGNVVRVDYDRAPDVHKGEIYQLRHGIRSEACGFFNRCRDLTLRNVEFNFLGNFGLVGQYSENLTYDNIRCRPRPGSGRTDAGFADFVQMSGCRGKVRIANSRFEGAHDDPINIHGTHLRATAQTAPDRVRVRFMHGQTYGFQPFFRGDRVEIVDRHTLLCMQQAVVKDVNRCDDYTFELVLDRPLCALPEGYGIEDVAVENVTWTPEVEIVNNYFARIPTRGILVTTRGKALIENNLFFRMPMPSVLVSDDARGWYESGPVRNLTIRRNTFVECGSPVVDINPEIDRYEGAVHRNITIEENRFVMSAPSAVLRVKAADDVTFRDNVISLPDALLPGTTVEALIEQENARGLCVEGNRIVSTQ